MGGLAAPVQLLSLGVREGRRLKMKVGDKVRISLKGKRFFCRSNNKYHRGYLIACLGRIGVVECVFYDNSVSVFYDLACSIPFDRKEYLMVVK